MKSDLMFMGCLTAATIGLIIICIFIFFTGCTMTFTNVSTHGTASDVVDDTQTASPNTSMKATVPLK